MSQVSRWIQSVVIAFCVLLVPLPSSLRPRAYGEIEEPTERLWYDASGELSVRIWRDVRQENGGPFHVDLGAVARGSAARGRASLGGYAGGWGMVDCYDVRAERPIVDWSVKIDWCPAAAHLVRCGRAAVVLLVGELTCDGARYMAAGVTQSGVVWKRGYEETSKSLDARAHEFLRAESWISANGEWATFDFLGGDVIGVRVRDGVAAKFSAQDVELQRPVRAAEIPKYLNAVRRRFGVTAAERAVEKLEMASSLKKLELAYVAYAEAADHGKGPNWDWSSAWKEFAACAAKSGESVDVRRIAETIVENGPFGEGCSGAIDMLCSTDAESLCEAIVRAGYRGERLVKSWVADTSVPIARRTAAERAIAAVDAARKRAKNDK